MTHHDDNEVPVLRAFMRDNGLLPEMPPDFQPDEQSAQRVLDRVYSKAPKTGSRKGKRQGDKKTRHVLFALAASLAVAVMLSPWLLTIAADMNAPPTTDAVFGAPPVSVGQEPSKPAVPDEVVWTVVSTVGVTAVALSVVGIRRRRHLPPQ